MQPFSKTTARLIASGFKSGLAPCSPGTFGSAAATCVWVAATASLPVDARIIAIILLAASLLAGLPATETAISDEQDKDPSWIVIDEWAGIFLTFAIAPQTTPLSILIGFVLFRVFDIVKFGPVGWAERIEGAWGIIADDLVAGFLAAMVLLAVR